MLPQVLRSLLAVKFTGTRLPTEFSLTLERTDDAATAGWVCERRHVMGKEEARKGVFFGCCPIARQATTGTVEADHVTVVIVVFFHRPRGETHPAHRPPRRLARRCAALTTEKRDQTTSAITQSARVVQRPSVCDVTAWLHHLCGDYGELKGMSARLLPE